MDGGRSHKSPDLFSRYNSFHDQLLLSSGSDSRVVVASLASLSSEPCGHLVEGEEGSKLEDGLVQVWPENIFLFALL